MRSFALVIEPMADARLAAALLLIHAAIAVLPWLARCPAPLAIALGLLTAAGLLRCVAQLPGDHCRLQSVAAGPTGWRARLAGETGLQHATLARSSRALAGWVLLELSSGGERVAWLLPRRALPADEFRRLKARVRLTC